MLPKHLNGTVECFVGDKAFWTSWGALRNNSYHVVRNSLHCICWYRTLAYVTLQENTRDNMDRFEGKTERPSPGMVPGKKRVLTSEGIEPAQAPLIGHHQLTVGLLHS